MADEIAEIISGVEGLEPHERASIRVGCATNEFEAIDSVGEGLIDNETAIKCMAVQDITADEVFPNGLIVNDFVTATLTAIYSSRPDENGVMDDGVNPTATNPRTGQRYDLSFVNEVVKKSYAQSETFTDPLGDEKPLNCELSSEAGFTYGYLLAQAGVPYNDNNYLKDAAILSDEAIQHIMYECYGNNEDIDIKIPGFNPLDDSILSMLAGIRRGQKAFETQEVSSLEPSYPTQTAHGQPIKSAGRD